MENLTLAVNAFLSLPHEEKKAFVSRVNDALRAEGTVRLKFRNEDQNSAGGLIP